MPATVITTNKYLVLTNIKHNGKRIEGGKGNLVDLADDEADELLKVKAIKPIDEKPAS